MITTTQIEIGKMLGEYKRKLDSDAIDWIISDRLAFAAMVIEELVNEGKLKVC